MKLSSTYAKKSAWITGAATLLMTACSGSHDATTSLDLSSGLASLPSVSSMLKANDGASTASVHKNGSLNLASVSGTAPYVKDLNASNVDTYFFNGSLAKLGSWSGLTSGQKQAAAQDYLGIDGHAGGQGACRMAQATGAIFDRMLSNGTSACYMKKMPFASSGVTITGVSSNAATFAQSSADRLVRIHAQHMTHNGGGGGGPSEMYVNIKVHGTDAVGADTYKATLYFCAGTSGSPIGQQGVENFEFNKSTGVYKTSHQSSSNSSEAVAYLKSVDNAIVVDLSKDRTASYSGSENSNQYHQSVRLTGDNKIFAKDYFNSQWGVSKNYSIASFSGSSLSTLRFESGAFKGLGSGSCGSGTCNWTYQGGTEFQDTKYVSTTSSSTYADVSSYDIAGDAEFADPTITAADLSGYDCGATPDAQVEMDFSDAAVTAIQQSCEADRLFDSQDSWQMCEGGRQNEHNIWEQNVH